MTIARASTGKLFLDNFNDADVSDWTVLSGTVTANAGRIRVARTATVPGKAIKTCAGLGNTGVLIAARVWLRNGTDTGSRAWLGASDIDWSESYFAGVTAGWSKQWEIGKEVAGVETILAFTAKTEDTNEHFYTVYWISGATDLYYYRDGIQKLSAGDDSHASLGYIFLCGSGESTVPMDYAEFDDVCAMTSRYATCSGLPTGYKFRITDGAGTNFTATESGAGVATVDLISAKFPCDSVAVLTGADVVVETLTMTDDCWGGDAYTYTASGISTRRRVAFIIY